MYQLEYRCRRCGEVFWSDDKTQGVHVFDVMRNHEDPVRQKFIDRTHECKDGGIGWADLIGARKEGK